MTSHSAEGTAPGKVILIGEHFVVHGAPALAVPVPSLGLTVRLERRQGTAATAAPEGHLGFCLETVLGALGVDPAGVTVTVESTIPVGSGMGSSAALSVAMARAGAELAGLVPDAARERELSMRCERAAHGRPSGIDTEVCVTGGPVWAEAGLFTPLGPEAGKGAGLVVLFAGQGGATAEMVARVGAFREGAPERFAELAAETRERCLGVRERLVRGADLAGLGALLTAQHGALREIGVSTPGLDRVVAAALDAGAAGAKLSGAGGGGAAVAVAPVAGIEALGRRLSSGGHRVVAAGPLL